MSNRITNIKATPAPSELVDADRQSAALRLCEEVVEMGIYTLRNAAEPIDVSMPAMRKGEGQTQECTKDGLKSLTHQVSERGEVNREGKPCATLIINERLMTSGVDLVTYLLHSLGGIAGMKSKASNAMKRAKALPMASPEEVEARATAIDKACNAGKTMRNYTRRNKVLVRTFETLGVDSDKGNDFVGGRGGICEVQMSAKTLARFQKKIEALDALNITSTPASEAPAKAKKPSTTLYVKASAEDLSPFRAFLGLDEDASNSEIANAVLSKLREDAGVSAPDLSIAV